MKAVLTVLFLLSCAALARAEFVNFHEKFPVYNEYMSSEALECNELYGFGNAFNLADSRVKCGVDFGGCTVESFSQKKMVESLSCKDFKFFIPPGTTLFHLEAKKPPQNTLAADMAIGVPPGGGGTESLDFTGPEAWVTLRKVEGQVVGEKTAGEWLFVKLTGWVSGIRLEYNIDYAVFAAFVSRCAAAFAECGELPCNGPCVVKEPVELCGYVEAKGLIIDGGKVTIGPENRVCQADQFPAVFENLHGENGRVVKCNIENVETNSCSYTGRPVEAMQAFIGESGGGVRQCN